MSILRLIAFSVFFVKVNSSTIGKQCTNNTDCLEPSNATGHFVCDFGLCVEGRSFGDSCAGFRKKCWEDNTECDYTMEKCRCKFGFRRISNHVWNACVNATYCTSAHECEENRVCFQNRCQKSFAKTTYYFLKYGYPISSVIIASFAILICCTVCIKRRRAWKNLKKGQRHQQNLDIRQMGQQIQMQQLSANNLPFPPQRIAGTIMFSWSSELFNFITGIKFGSFRQTDQSFEK